MSDKTSLHYYVNMPGNTLPGTSFSTITEALTALTDSSCLSCEKQFPAPVSDLPPVIVHIGEGIYREKLIITRPNVTFEGAGADKTILVYGDAAFDLMPEGDKRGTFRTASVRIDTHDFTAKHLTFQNDSGFGHTVGQALAVYVDGDRNAFYDCRFLGSQDTVFDAPLPLKEAQPGGFKGPGEFKPRTIGRHYYENCFIQGDVDFIFGSGIAWFEHCTIYSKLPGDRVPPESPEDEVIYGYVTAASTPMEEPYGYVFHECSLESDCPPHSIYLGRPWREWAKTVFLHCELGAHIHPAGWQDWKKPHGHFYYGEYASYGPGASPATRADFSHQLTDAEAAEYTVKHVMKGWEPQSLMLSVVKGVPTSMYQEALSRQLALDYCCSPADVADSKNHFTIYVPQEGRRRFQEQTVCRLKIAVVNGKLLVTGSEEIVAECRKRYADVTGEWFFDMKQLRELEELLAPFGAHIAQVHPFFLPESGGIASSDLPSALLSDARDFELIRYDQDAILQFRGDDRFDQAFAFDPDAPDVLGIAAVRDDEILGMAGASADSSLFWQIGINVTPHAREMHVGSTLVRLLAQDILAHGAIPYYGTSMSHIASQRVAHRAGFAVAWAELITEEVR